MFADPIELSGRQIAAFTDAYDDNRRPIQDLNGRSLIIGD